MGVSVETCLRRRRDVMLGRRYYVFLRRPFDDPIRRCRDAPLRRLGDVLSRRRWVVSLETYLRHHRDVQRDNAATSPQRLNAE